jgi:hypothetical protein
MIDIIMNSEFLNTENTTTETEEKSYCHQEPFKTITVTSFGEESYKIKFQYFIDQVDIKKEIQRQVKETRNEHLPINLIILVHKTPGSSHSPCRQNHIFLKDEQLFMFVKLRVCTMDHSKHDHRSPGLNKDVSCE